MSERKVLNKYYPPDFDPSKIPRMKLAKNRQYTVRLMAPFNMRCATCGEYIYKGKKFNARKEDVENQDYLGIRIYRFYIKCTRCLQEISFKTDPKNTDYEIEAGATRNFMALKLAEEQAKKEDDEKKEEEANNPMKLLEIRTEQSKQEIELLESLEELKELNRRQRNIDYEGMLKQYQPETTEERKAREQKEDDDFIKSAFGTTSTSTNPSTQRIIAEEIVEEIDETNDEPPTKTLKLDQSQPKIIVKKTESWNKSIGALKKPALNSLVKAKRPDASSLVKLKSTVAPETITDQKNQSTGDKKSTVGDTNLSTNEKKSVPSSTVTATVTTAMAEKSDQIIPSTDDKKSVSKVTSYTENLSTGDKKSAHTATSTATVSSVVSSETGSSKAAGSGLSLLAGYSGSDSDGSGSD